VKKTVITTTARMNQERGAFTDFRLRRSNHADSGLIRRTGLLMRSRKSISEPRGHTQPQKNLPIIVAVITIPMTGKRFVQ
jgi:hypothetical protein